jgi:hypothetical protein
LPVTKLSSDRKFTYCELTLVFFDMRDKLAEIATRPRS